jgi:hypothetical protein
MQQAGKPVFVEAFVAESPVERFNVSVLIGLAGFDQAKLHTALVRPGDHGLTAELFAVVAANHLG